MIELVVVLLVMGMLALVAAPKVSQLTGYKDLGYRDQIKSMIEYARKTAVAQRRYTCVKIAGNTMTLTGDLTTPEVHVAGTCSTTALVMPTGSNTLTPPSNVTVTPAVIQFDNEGKPDAGVTLTVADTASGTTSSLTVEADTGYVHN